MNIYIYIYKRERERERERKTEKIRSWKKSKKCKIKRLY